jgi:hypothetical protein
VFLRISKVFLFSISISSASNKQQEKQVNKQITGGKEREISAEGSTNNKEKNAMKKRKRTNNNPGKKIK